MPKDSNPRRNSKKMRVALSKSLPLSRGPARKDFSTWVTRSSRELRGGAFRLRRADTEEEWRIIE
jgi:hypothetical protein